MKWNLRLAAANRGIWKASEFQRMLAERGLVISTGKMSGLWSGNPNVVKLDELDIICAVLGCGVDELLIPEPNTVAAPPSDRRRRPRRRRRHAADRATQPRRSIDAAEVNCRTVREHHCRRNVVGTKTIAAEAVPRERQRCDAGMVSRCRRAGSTRPLRRTTLSSAPPRSMPSSLARPAAGARRPRTACSTGLSQSWMVGPSISRCRSARYGPAPTGGCPGAGSLKSSLIWGCSLMTQ